MDLNITLLGEMITFLLLTWFTMKFIWPPVVKAMKDRQKKIAEGLEAAERGKYDLELAKRKSGELLKAAKTQAGGILDQAGVQANQVIDASKTEGREESQRILANAKADIETQFERAKEELLTKVADLAVSLAEEILKKEVNKASHEQMLKELIAEI